MQKTAFKKAFGLFAAAGIILFVSLLIGSSAFAASGERTNIYPVDYPRSGDPNNNGAWGYGKLTHMNGCVSTGARATTLFALGSYSGNIAYCIEPGTSTQSGALMTERDENFFDSIGPNSTISGSEIKILIGRILQYGYRGCISTGWNSAYENDANCIAHAYATQLLIWETVVGERDASFNHVSTGGYSPILDYVSSAHPLRGRILAYYNSMVSSVQNHSLLPSFCSSDEGSAQVTELSWDGSGYSAAFTDTNGVLGSFAFSSSLEGVSFSVSGNTLKVSVSKAPKSEFTVTASKKNCTRQGTVVLTDGVYQNGTGIQDVVSFANEVTDSVTGYSKLKVTFGSLQIKKTSEDGKVEGISLSIKGNDIDRTVVTGEDGTFKADELTPGIYTVTEESIDRYVPQEVKRVTVVGGQVTTVDFYNVLKRGDLKVTKSSEDGLKEGMRFHLYGTSLSGIPVDEYAVTDENGTAYFKDILISGASPYTIEETDTPVRYVVPEDQKAAVNWKEVTNAGFSNILKKFNVTVTKSDKAEGTARGDASLAGAVYGIYKGGALIDTYTTDADGQFTSKEYICGDDWTVREITPSAGYLLDTVIHKIGSEPGNFTAEHNLIVSDVTEEVIKGNIALIKHTDDGETKIETPESTASFEVYLKGAGSFENAEPDERDTVVCDQYGYGGTKDLPYGVYTVRQTSGWEGRETIKDFDVMISENGKTYRYLINNADFESYFKVVKVDAETGQKIPYAGAGFKIYDPDGNPVTMRLTYPTPTVIDTFYTDAEGELVTPEELAYGTGYSLVEVQAPYGYVLDSTPVSFDVVQDRSMDEKGITVITVNKPDMPQKGTISITKSGEVFYGVSISGDDEKIYKPVYKTTGLSGAKYEIIAFEDIYTPDGTLRLKKGETADTVTTDQNGYAESKALYLGKYEVVETAAPDGMVLNKASHVVELTYAGQNESITHTGTSFVNDRQKAAVRLKKVLEQNDIFGIGTGEEIKNIRFGLFADEELISKSGAVIPEDALIEIIDLEGNGEAEIKTDLPFGRYYVKELGTDEHYVLSSVKYPFSFSYAGQDDTVVDIAVNGGNPIENELIYGRITGKKTDENGEALEGAVIGIFKAHEKEFTKETALMTVVSGKDGGFSFENVPYGDWIIREAESPEGFVLNDTLYPAAISENGQEIGIEIVNEAIYGSIQITKVDGDEPDVRLTGAVFEVFRDLNGNGRIDGEDESVGNLNETSLGIYELEELPYGSYLVKETQAPEGFVTDSNEYPVSIAEDEKTYVIETLTGTGFANTAKKGSLKILKTSSDGKVYGFTFRVTGANGYDMTFTTDEKGEILIEGLRIGDYTVTEVLDDASLSYTLPDAKEASVKTDAVTVVKMHNILRDTPKTGDLSNTGLWISLALLSGIGIVMTLIGMHRKNEKEDNAS